MAKVAKKGTQKRAGEPALAARQRKPGERCGMCGHWSPATEYGVDEKSGYCNRWEKLTDRDFWCDEYLSKAQFQHMQDQLAEQNEDFIDEET